MNAALRRFNTASIFFHSLASLRRSTRVEEIRQRLKN